jgi:hypothetical protein
VAITAVDEVLRSGRVPPDHCALAAIRLVAPHAGLIAMHRSGNTALSATLAGVATTAWISLLSALAYVLVRNAFSEGLWPGADIATEALDRPRLDHIVRFKRPHYRLVEAPPKNNSSKVLKAELPRLLA